MTLSQTKLSHAATRLIYLGAPIFFLKILNLPNRGRMIRWEDVKSLEGVVGGSGNLSRKSGASGHWDTAQCRTVWPEQHV